MNDLARLQDRSWTRFRGAVDRLTPDLLGSPTTAGWTAREMVGHLAFWFEAAEAVVVAMLRGAPLRPDFAFGSGYVPDPDAPWPIADVHNAREAAWAKPRPAREVVARLDAGQRSARQLLEALSPDGVADERYRAYVLDICSELDAHLLELTALLGEPAPTEEVGGPTFGEPSAPPSDR